MSAPESENRRDAAGREIAPAPPPPPHVELSLGGGSTQGFSPSGNRMLLEITGVLVVVTALGVLAFVLSGRLAAWLTPFVPESVDRQIGEVSERQLGFMREPCSERATRYVEEIAAPLLRPAEPLPFPFHFVVAKDESVNAFALPGGFVTVNSGLLEAAESGEEVAGVLGHEIQHALLRHGTRRVLRQLGGSVALSLLTFGYEPTGLSGVAAQLTSLSYDRDQESEADARGVELLLRARVDPRGLVRFFQRLEEKQQGLAPPVFLSTHPDSGQRSELVARAARGGTFTPLPAPPKNPCSN